MRLRPGSGTGSVGFIDAALTDGFRTLLLGPNVWQGTGFRRT